MDIAGKITFNNPYGGGRLTVYLPQGYSISSYYNPYDQMGNVGAQQGGNALQFQRTGNYYLNAIPIQKS